jgi:hypothetical protein
MKRVTITIVQKGRLGYEYRWIEGCYRVDIFKWTVTEYNDVAHYYITSGSHPEPTFQEFKESVPDDNDATYEEYIEEIINDEEVSDAISAGVQEAIKKNEETSK